MNILLVKNGKIEIKNGNGNLITTFGNHISNAEFNYNQSLIIIVLSNGKIELRKNNGSLIREMNLNAIYAKWYDNNILITTKNNKNELRNINGSLIKNIWVFFVIE